MSGPYASSEQIVSAVRELSADPSRAGAFFDLDGTLAPIVGRPEDTALASRTRELLARIGGRYAISAIVTGRQAREARRIVGLDELTYVGNHGFEILGPGEEEAEPAPALRGHEDDAAGFVTALGGDRLAEGGMRVEDKGAIVALHWRGVPDEAAAEAVAETIADEAAGSGLRVHRGRKVVELRPPVDVDKGIGLGSVLDRVDVGAAFYAGDDRTDIDGFRVLGARVADGRLATAVRVAVVSEETPVEVAAAADLAVDGPEAFVAVLEALA